MSTLKSHVPSAALVVAAIALIVAMAGSAFAGPGALEKELNKAAVKAIAVKQITKAAPKLSVKSAETAETANTAGSADNVMSASVPIAPSCTFDSSTGGITAVMVGTKCDVTFPVSVEDCAVGATPLHPMEDVGGEATIRKLGGRVVKVTRNDPLGNGPVAGLFAITAICP